MLFKKTDKPVLSPREDVEWASGAVFNPGTWYEDGKIHLLFRAIPAGYKKTKLKERAPGEPEFGFDDSYVSYIGYAVSTDGINFEWAPEPFIKPGSAVFNKHGAEDPRICKIGDEFLITYTALQRPAFDPVDGVRIGLASTQDFKNIDHHSIVGPPNKRDKDAVIFPRSINGKIGMIHRITPNMQLIWFDSLDELYAPSPEKWSDHLASLDEHVLMKPAFEWESLKIGAGPTPVETEHGWLIIYHGVSQNHEYRMGLALLDLEDPTKIIARAPEYVLSPELDFEKTGDVPNVVFPEGAVIIDDILHVYYGAADLVIGHAYAPLNDVLNYLLQYKN